MKKKISLYVRSLFALIHIVFVKIFNISNFTSSYVQDFSLSTKISIREKGIISFGKHIHTKRNVFFDADGGRIEVKSGCFFNNGCMIVAKEHIRIGENTAFGPNVLIYDHDHDIYSNKDIRDSGFVKSPVVIGDNVWIGANSVILHGSIIGDGCVIGAGSVIKGTYPPYSVVVQKRADEVVKKRYYEREGVHGFNE